MKTWMLCKYMAVYPSVTPQLMRGKMNLEIKKKYFSKWILNQNISIKATCSLVKALPTPLH